MRLKESTGGVKQLTGSKMRVRLISPGKGSSGYYSPDVIKESAPLFKAGTHMNLDHPTQSERFERPEGSLRDLVGVLESDGQVMPDGSIEADVKIMPTWRELISEAAPYIGVSINADGDITESAERGRIVESLSAINSVDFVTKPGRGGKIISILESARPLTEATASNLREWLDTAVREKYPNTWGVEDYDDTNAYYTADGGTYMGITYQNTGTGVTLTGEPFPVVKETTFHPVQGGAEPSKTVTESKGETLEITESEYKRLTEADKKLPVADDKIAKLEEQIKELQAELEKEKAKTKTAKESAVKAQAGQIVEEAFAGIDAPRGKARLVESATAAEDFDPEAFKKAVLEEAAEYTPKTGQVTGLGGKWYNITESETGADYDAEVLNALKGL